MRSRYIGQLLSLGSLFGYQHEKSLKFPIPQRDPRFATARIDFGVTVASAAPRFCLNRRCPSTWVTEVWRPRPPPVPSCYVPFVSEIPILQVGTAGSLPATRNPKPQPRAVRTVPGMSRILTNWKADAKLSCETFQKPYTMGRQQLARSGSRNPQATHLAHPLYRELWRLLSRRLRLVPAKECEKCQRRMWGCAMPLLLQGLGVQGSSWFRFTGVLCRSQKTPETLWAGRLQFGTCTGEQGTRMRVLNGFRC